MKQLGAFSRHLSPLYSRVSISKGFRSYSTSSPESSIPATISIVPTVQELTKKESYEHDLKSSLIGHLHSRFLVESVTDERLLNHEADDSKRFTVYCGADPSADSLHLGNLLPLIGLLHFVLRGHDVVGLVGGATGAVGDPSGRTTERSQIAKEVRISNINKIENQMMRFFTNGVEYAKSRNYPVKSEGKLVVHNNNSWWESMTMLDFLEQYGRYIRVSSMLGRESIQSRLKSQKGLGFNEFAYQTLQAYDFWHLFKSQKVNMQLGGNDQWGNITAGIDLISRLQKHTVSEAEHREAYGVTVPLLTTPSGEKFGKSAGNAVFISAEKTTPYQLYQYFINTPDEIVRKLLKVFTLLPLTTIDNEILSLHEKDPGSRIAQRVLAREVVDLIHGVGLGNEMAYITSFLFPTPEQPFDDNISADKLITNFKRSGILKQIRLDSFNNIPDLKMSTVLAKVLGKSKTETKNLIKSGGIYLGLGRDNFEDPEDIVLFDKSHHTVDGKLLLVRVGKQNYHVVEFL